MRMRLITSLHAAILLGCSSTVLLALQASTVGSSGISESAIQGLPASFVGNLPCADCPGIRYQVNLFPDHTFASRMTYLERKTEFADHGSWRIAGDGKTLVLLGKRGAREQFALRNAETLRKLDSEGHEINSKFDYEFKRLTAFAPIEFQRHEGREDCAGRHRLEADQPERSEDYPSFATTGTLSGPRLKDQARGWIRRMQPVNGQLPVERRPAEIRWRGPNDDGMPKGHGDRERISERIDT